MQNYLLYGGIVINVVGVLYLMAYAIKNTYAFHKTRNRPVEADAAKSDWAKKRAIGFGLMIFGALLVLISYFV
ncbi:MAG TPA: hypothetical protein DCE24_06855 [Porphyromonadaceae bacterium]|nr:hypothetical protein [Porphyromonadaceae bacterium]